MAQDANKWNSFFQDKFRAVLESSSSIPRFVQSFSLLQGSFEIVQVILKDGKMREAIVGQVAEAVSSIPDESPKDLSKSQVDFRLAMNAGSKRNMRKQYLLLTRFVVDHVLAKVTHI